MAVKEAKKDIDFMDEHFIGDDEKALQNNKYLTTSVSNKIYSINIGIYESQNQMGNNKSFYSMKSYQIFYFWR